MKSVVILTVMALLFAGCSDDSSSSPETSCIQERPWLYQFKPYHDVGSCSEEYELCINAIKVIYWEGEYNGHRDFVPPYSLFGGMWSYYQPIYEECVRTVDMSERCQEALDVAKDYFDPYRHDSLATYYANDICDEYK